METYILATGIVEILKPFALLIGFFLFCCIAFPIYWILRTILFGTYMEKEILKEMYYNFLDFFKKEKIKYKIIYPLSLPPVPPERVRRLGEQGLDEYHEELAGRILYD